MALINVPYFFLTGEGFYLVLVRSTYVRLMPRPAEIISRGWSNSQYPLLACSLKVLDRNLTCPYVYYP